ncbi:CCA tRNA nucleotidyltransferase [Rhodobacteraceae bacterium RKSG542]|uniref:CCA tRNA nucleotidyltransferase n=1 Tax=Pseudovibrio flavus TaxID=2529854 RepID=UPI0012BBAD55|nr:CCA tRNA nucleotidyltransferase [Pseudovibrio flavus]MTI18997.1 CCA tRNA nucleotidyltransferase [Pseudovibrio flavus]
MESLKNKDWLTSPALQAVFDVLEQDGDKARVVGGPVRNALLGVSVDDVDIACTALPAQTLERAKKAGMKAVPTGIDHGTVTLISDGHPYEVTTLREDVETHGRHATVLFGKDWEKDARRRDFTLNALYVDRSGNLYDPLGGLEDCHARRIRFIGNANKRIKEDYLRILRFFRFFSMYGLGEADDVALQACRDEREGLRNLSAERVTKEMLKLLEGPRALEAIRLMQDCGLLDIALGCDVNTEMFERLTALEQMDPSAKNANLRLFSLTGTQECSGLRLSNGQNLRGKTALSLCSGFLANGLGLKQIKATMVSYERSAVVDGFLLFAASPAQATSPKDLQDAYEFIKSWSVPVFPLRGKDLIGAGFKAGPELGRALEAARIAWAETDYAATKDELLAGLNNKLSPSDRDMRP